jgi:hypothetical protein
MIDLPFLQFSMGVFPDLFQFEAGARARRLRIKDSMAPSKTCGDAAASVDGEAIEKCRAAVGHKTFLAASARRV